jgi:hypothetical protein
VQIINAKDGSLLSEFPVSTESLSEITMIALSADGALLATATAPPSAVLSVWHWREVCQRSCSLTYERF